MPGTHTLVLGAGFGGLTAATELAKRLPDGHRVTLVDRRDSFLMGLAKLQILDGRRAPGEGAHPIRGVERHGVTFRQAEVTAIDVPGRSAVVGGERVEWDHLVVALGAELDAGALPGADAARNLYDAAGVAAFHDDLTRIERGDVLIVVAGMPFKCPPAPYEAAMLAKAFLDARGVDARVTVCSPEPQPLPIAGPECGDVVREWVEERGVDVVNGVTPAAVDAARRLVRFQDGSERRFDALAVVPPHRVPRVLVDAGLAPVGGWVPADRETLATAHANVWAVGDCNVVKLPVGKPLVKAGVMAEAEARIVAANLAARIAGEAESARFDGKGLCYLELGAGDAVEVVGDFYATPAPVVRTTPPGPKALERKTQYERDLTRELFGA